MFFRKLESSRIRQTNFILVRRCSVVRILYPRPATSCERLVLEALLPVLHLGLGALEIRLDGLLLVIIPLPLICQLFRVLIKELLSISRLLSNYVLALSGEVLLLGVGVFFVPLLLNPRLSEHHLQVLLSISCLITSRSVTRLCYFSRTA